jgi:hypothetical protein
MSEAPEFDEVFAAAATLGRELFGSTPAGQARKLQEEAGEWADAPGDLEEMADCLLALVIGVAASGHTADDLLEAARAKIALCRRRKWVETEAGVFRHVKEG